MVYSVDGNWSDWDDWSECPVTCGGGVQNRSRTCTNPPPAFEGESCPGPSDETRACGIIPCPGKCTMLRSALFSKAGKIMHTQVNK